LVACLGTKKHLALSGCSQPSEATFHLVGFTLWDRIASVNTIFLKRGSAGEN
jgi:hypothetical protein